MRKPPPEAWLLPLEDYDFTVPYGVRFGKLHAGIDLAAAEGTPYKAIHAGTVTAAGFTAATATRSPSSRRRHRNDLRPLPPPPGPGRRRGQPGSPSARSATPATRTAPTSTSRSTSTAPPPTRFLFSAPHGVDIKLKIESVYGNVAAS